MELLENLKGLASLLGLLGVPTIGALVAWSVKQIVKIRKENEARELRHDKGLQIIIRFHLNSMYYQAMDRGSITDEDLRIWMESYEIYHGLGENGVMDSKRDKMLGLKSVEHYNHD